MAQRTQTVQVHLDKPEDWSDWYAQLERRGRSKELWKFLDPSGNGDLAAPEFPYAEESDITARYALGKGAPGRGIQETLGG